MINEKQLFLLEEYWRKSRLVFNKELYLHIFRSSHQRFFFYKKDFLENLGVFRWILRNFPVQFFHRAPSSDYLCISWSTPYASLTNQMVTASPEAVVRRCSVKKVFLEISQNSQENTCARVSFLNKLQ